MSDIQKSMQADIHDLESGARDQGDRWFAWADAQDIKRDEFFNKIGIRIDSLKDAISQKTEMDSAMISQLSNLSKRMDTEEANRAACDKIIYETAFQVKSLVERLARHDLSKMAIDITAAHDRVRDHEDRIRPLEKKEGKLARGILERLLLTSAGGVMGYIITRLLS